MGFVHNCIWVLFALAQVLEIVRSDYDINWIYPPLLKFLVNNKAIASITTDRPFKAGIIPYSVRYENKGYEMTFIIYPNRDNGTNWWNENDWIISSLSHKNAITARNKANNNNNHPKYEEITERNTEDGIKIYIYPTGFKREAKKKFKKRSHRQFPYKCRAKIIGLNVDETEVDISTHPWRKKKKQTAKFRKEIVLTAIMKMLTDDLEISSIIFKDNTYRKCPHNGEVSLREIATFQQPMSWYEKFGFVMDTCNKKIKETKLKDLKPFCMKTQESWNETVEPFREFFNSSTDDYFYGDDTLQDMLGHFVSNTVKKDKWLVKRKVKDVNEDKPQRNCKWFLDIVEAVTKCGMKIKYLWKSMEKDITLIYAPDKIKEESKESAESVVYVNIEYDRNEYDRNDEWYWQYLMNGYIRICIVLLLLMGIICGCSIGFISYHINEQYSICKEDDVLFQTKIERI